MGGSRKVGMVVQKQKTADFLPREMFNEPVNDIGLMNSIHWDSKYSVNCGDKSGDCLEETNFKETSDSDQKWEPKQ